MIYNRTNSVPEVIAGLETENNELKTSQPVGADAIKISVTEAANLYDVVATVNAFNDAEWRVTFTPDVGSNQYTEFGMSFFSTPDLLEYTFFDDPNDVSSDNQKSFMIYVLGGNNNCTVSMRFQFKSYYPGTMGVVRTI